MALSILSLCGVALSAYVGLRLEPLYIRVATVEKDHHEHAAYARALTDDYISFKAQTIEILRAQNEKLDEVRRETIRANR